MDNAAVKGRGKRFPQFRTVPLSDETRGGGAEFDWDFLVSGLSSNGICGGQGVWRFYESPSSAFRSINGQSVQKRICLN